MVSVLKRIAKLLENIAVEIEKNDISSLQILRKIKENLVVIEKDIDEYSKQKLSQKISQTYIDNNLKRHYRNAEITLSLVRKAIEEIEISSLDLEHLRVLQQIRTLLLRIIAKLDDFYKNHLNPKFNFHDITFKMLNLRLNELKEEKRKLDRLLAKKVRK